MEKKERLNLSSFAGDESSGVCWGREGRVGRKRFLKQLLVLTVNDKNKIVFNVLHYRFGVVLVIFLLD